MTPADNAVIPRAIVNVAIQHPSIFRKRLVTVDPTARPGDWVKVETEEGEHLGFGLFNPKSEIAIRLVFPARAELTSSLWDTILDRSISIRRDTLRLDSVTDAYRLIHAEGDGLPGLVVDRFGDVLVEQGNLPAALDAYRADLAIAERIAKADPKNTEYVVALAELVEQDGDLDRCR